MPHPKMKKNKKTLDVACVNVVVEVKTVLLMNNIENLQNHTLN